MKEEKEEHGKISHKLGKGKKDKRNRNALSNDRQETRRRRKNMKRRKIKEEEEEI